MYRFRPKKTKVLWLPLNKQYFGSSRNAVLSIGPSTVPARVSRTFSIFVENIYFQSHQTLFIRYREPVRDGRQTVVARKSSFVSLRKQTISVPYWPILTFEKHELYVYRQTVVASQRKHAARFRGRSSRRPGHEIDSTRRFTTGILWRACVQYACLGFIIIAFSRYRLVYRSNKHGERGSFFLDFRRREEPSASGRFNNNNKNQVHV